MEKTNICVYSVWFQYYDKIVRIKRQYMEVVRKNFGKTKYLKKNSTPSVYNE